MNAPDPIHTGDVPQVQRNERPARAGGRRGAPAVRIPRRSLHGILLLDKPIGLSSNDALQKVKRIFKAEKAGHTGTLDPLATGLLPICFGAATKFSQVSLDADKAYTATLKLGQTTVGGDREGDVVLERPVQVDEAMLAAACARFTGAIDQLPPMHSALKKDGKALYEYARAGIEVERPTRTVTIHSIDMLSWDPVGHHLTIHVRCTKGTYIRTLAEDIGEVLGCGAHLAALRRTGSGTLSINDVVSLEALADMDEAQRDALLRSPDCLLTEWPEVRLNAEDAARFLTGLRRRIKLPDHPAVRVYGPEPTAFLGSGHITAGELIADRLLSPIEVQALMTT
ncbi:MAG: tRNA pseudouridine(55) synthase TruB [Burkholderiales bacterium PBB6]|nr:MAG: tRNA pseudouridine(55) synthase TruB [Burkholderiales bacterium PBB6]